ncbi:hypothetical protein HN51_061411 [Arachis hypogaea]
MTGSSNSTNIITTSTHSHRVYICVVTLELASIAIKYQGINTNPFQEIHATMLLFLLATPCHAIALAITNHNIVIMPNSITIIVLFHVSGTISCESLLWILVAQLWWFIILNVLMILVVGVCFYYKHIYEIIIDLHNNLLLLVANYCFHTTEPCDEVGNEGPSANQKAHLEVIIASHI